MATLKVFFRFCVENEYLERDPALVLRTPKKQRSAVLDVLDSRELARLLRVAELDDVCQPHVPRQARARPPAARPVRLRRPWKCGFLPDNQAWEPE